MQERYDLVCRIENRNKPTPLNGDFAVVAFQAVRGLLINVVKHAGAKEANVYVTRKENAVVIGVEDQGKGFVPDELDLSRSQGGGFGLFSIRERISLLGGKLEINSSRGDGAIAQVMIPVSSTNFAESLHELTSARQVI